MLVLTGAKGCGKTSLLKGMAEDLDVQGVLSQKVFRDGTLQGIMINLLPGGQQLEAAGLEPFDGAQKVGRFYFRADLFETVESFFDAPDKAPFVLDEFGPLEFEGGGHFGLFEKIRTQDITLLVVVRKDLLPDFLGRFAQTIAKVWDLDDQDPDKVFAEISSALKVQQAGSLQHFQDYQD